jgi:hypothetical protein
MDEGEGATRSCSFTASPPLCACTQSVFRMMGPAGQSQRLARGATSDHETSFRNGARIPPPIMGISPNTPNAALEQGTPEARLRYVHWEIKVNNIIYIIGLIVVILAVLSFFGLR